MGPTVKSFSPALMIVVSALREGYLLYVFFLFFYQITKTGTFAVKRTKVSTYIFLCSVLAIPYIVIGGHIGDGIVAYLSFFSGPILFYLISNLTLSKKTVQKFFAYSYLLLGIVSVFSFLFYFIQEKVLASVDPSLLSRFYKQTFAGAGKLRLVGIGFHPTTTGFLYVYLVGMAFFYKQNYFMSFFGLFCNYLSRARSALFGIVMYIYTKFPKILKTFCFIIGIFGLALIYKMFINKSLYKYLEPSAVVHLLHLFEKGPINMIQYLKGAGLGTVSPYTQTNPLVHLESDFYLYSIQVNIINLICYFLAVWGIIKELKKGNEWYDKYSLLLIYTFFLGCVIFPLHSLRFTSNFVWIFLGIVFSQKKNFIRRKNYVFSYSSDI